MPTQGILLAKRPAGFVIRVNLIRGDHENNAGTRCFGQSLQQVGRAHHIGGEGFNGIAIGAPNKRLRAQMQNNIRFCRVHDSSNSFQIAQIRYDMVATLCDLGEGEQVWRCFRLKRKPCDIRTHLVKPECGPCPLEASMPREEHTLATPEGGIRQARRGDGHAQTFHGAFPLSQRDSSRFFSRNVSMGCQNPRWKYARS